MTVEEFLEKSNCAYDENTVKSLLKEFAEIKVKENTNPSNELFSILVSKAAKYDSLVETVAKYYEVDDEGNDIIIGDLCDIGEKVCTDLGFL